MLSEFKVRVFAAPPTVNCIGIVFPEFWITPTPPYVE